MSFKFNNPIQKKTGFKYEKDAQNEFLFHAIYFLDYITGSLLVSKKYTNQFKTNSNEDLISGFLTALNLFIKEIKSGDDEIQEINFRKTRILYERRGRLSVIAITRKFNLQLERKLLSQIVTDFYNQFEVSLNNFNGMVESSILDYKNKLDTLNFYDPSYKI